MVQRLQTPLPLEELTRPLEMANTATFEEDYPQLWPGPLLVIAAEPAWTLTADLRQVAIMLANAGTEPWEISGIASAPPWLGPVSHPFPWRLPPDGQPVTFHFAFQPVALPAGENRHPLVLQGPAGAERFDMTLHVPDEPVIWFAAGGLKLANPYTERPFRVGGAEQLRIWQGAVPGPLGKAHTYSAYTPHALAPGTYWAQGFRASSPAPATLMLEGYPPIAIPAEGGLVNVPGVVSPAAVYNLGPRAAAGRLVAFPGGIHVSPEWLELAPGQQADLTVTAAPDPRLLRETEGRLDLINRLGQLTGSLPVDVALPRNEPIPICTKEEIDLGAVARGAHPTVQWVVWNRGQVPATLRLLLPEGVRGYDQVVVAPGARTDIYLTIDADRFAAPDGNATVVVPVESNSTIAGVDRFALRAAFRVVSITVTPDLLDFGEVPFLRTVHRSLAVVRSDGEAARVILTVPDDLKDQLTAVGAKASFYNRLTSPDAVSGSITVQEVSLELTVQVPVRAVCSTPVLHVQPLEQELRPGERFSGDLRLDPVGGNLTVTRVSVPEGLRWLKAKVDRSGGAVSVTVKTHVRQRGTLRARLELRTNMPRSQPVLTEVVIHLRPTWRMRLQDLFNRFRRLLGGNVGRSSS